MAGTNQNLSTPVARGRSGPVRFVVIDALNREHGTYKAFKTAQEYIQRRFKFQEQDDDRRGRYPVGWDVFVRIGGRTDRNIQELSLKRLREVLDYDPETGALTWRIRTGPMCKFGKPAGRINSQGYRRISIDGRNYNGGHLAWFHFHGVRPTVLVDHKNLDKTDNRIENLRLATTNQNAMNRARNSRNTTGLKGAARFNNPNNRAKFRAQIRHNGKRIFLGLFHTAEEAHEAYCKAARELHGEFARLN